MSLKILLKDLKDEDIDNFDKHLVIEEESKKNKKQKQKCPWIIPPKYNIIRRDQTHVYIPFYWGVNYFSKSLRVKRENCSPIKISFLGELREEQKEIYNESISLLNNNGSCLMAIYPGGGKCLAKGTRVLLSNGDYKNVENVRIGDFLVGDDLNIRIVKNIGRGREILYTLSDVKNPFIYFDCNESHILTLMNMKTNTLEDISVKDFLSLERNNYKLCYLDYDSIYFNLFHKRNELRKKCNCKILDKPIFCVRVYNDFEYLLRDIMLCGFVINDRTNNNVIYFEDPHRIFLDMRKRVINYFDFTIDKKEIGDYYGFELNKNGRFLLWNGIVTHNTITSLAISSKIGLRTMILVNKLVLIDQWINTIKNVFGDYARIQHLKTKTKINTGCQFYIMNAINVAKRSSEEYEKLGIGFLIVDECHLIMTKIFSRALGYICPRYLLGLSATPFRPDGFDSLLNLYFGLRKVVRKLHKPHKVFLIETDIKIVAKKDERGELIWNSVIDQQTQHEERNNKIVQLCIKFSDRNILILSKRIFQIQTIYNKLLDINESATFLKDSDNSFDKNARILIATYQKVGTGFSHDKLDMLILATDAEEYFIQYLGRVFRRPNVEPIIIDLVDNNPILKRHYLTRRRIYQECGGILSNLEI